MRDILYVQTTKYISLKNVFINPIFFLFFFFPYLNKLYFEMFYVRIEKPRKLPNATIYISVNPLRTKNIHDARSLNREYIRIKNHADVEF